MVKTHAALIMNEIQYLPIGIIHSPYNSTENMPIQPSSARGVSGMVEIFPEYEAGLKDIEGFSHIILVYHFHLSKEYKLVVKPFLEEKEHGVFATRAPKRPNGIGISVVQLIKVDKNILHVENIDIADGTPLLDIKPFVPDFEPGHDIKTGWLEKSRHKISTAKSDSRFNSSSEE